MTTSWVDNAFKAAQSPTVDGQGSVHIVKSGLRIGVEAARELSPEIADEMVAKGLAELDLALFPKAGNIDQLASHLARKLGGDPGFHTKCVESEELAGYSYDSRAAICAVAHKLVVGVWPSQGPKSKGGAGSGNWSHSGRPGQRGGSAGAGGPAGGPRGAAASMTAGGGKGGVVKQSGVETSNIARATGGVYTDEEFSSLYSGFGYNGQIRVDVSGPSPTSRVDMEVRFREPGERSKIAFRAEALYLTGHKGMGGTTFDREVRLRGVTGGNKKIADAILERHVAFAREKGAEHVFVSPRAINDFSSEAYSRLGFTKLNDEMVLSIPWERGA